MNLWQVGFYHHDDDSVTDATEEEIRAACAIWGWTLVEKVQEDLGWAVAHVEVDPKTEAQLMAGETVELEHSSGLVATIELP